MERDKYDGQGGTYEVKNGVRVLVKGSTLEHHEDGDGARDEDGNPIVNVPAAEKPEPALPEPIAMPWAAADKAKPKAEARPAAAVDTTTKPGA